MYYKKNKNKDLLEIIYLKKIIFFFNFFLELSILA